MRKCPQQIQTITTWSPMYRDNKAVVLLPIKRNQRGSRLQRFYEVLPVFLPLLRSNVIFLKSSLITVSATEPFKYLPPHLQKQSPQDKGTRLPGFTHSRTGPKCHNASYKRRRKVAWNPRESSTISEKPWRLYTCYKPAGGNH